MKRRFILLFVAILLVLLAGCSSSDQLTVPEQAEQKLSESDKVRLEQATPTQLLELYVEGINTNNPYLSIAAFSDSYFTENQTLEEAKMYYIGIKINNLQIKEDEEKNASKKENEYHLIMSYTLEVENNSSHPTGPGEYYYFVKLIKDSNNAWRISNLATSP